MKNVWILNHYAQIPGGVGGTRHFHLAENLIRHDWHANLIAASVDHATGQQRLAPNENVKLETIHSIPFLWIRTPEYFGNDGSRVRNMLVYTYRVLRSYTTRLLPKPDAVLGSSVHPFAAFAGLILARRFKVPFVFEVRDLWPQTLVDMGVLRENSFITWTLRKLELWLYRRATRIVVLLPRAWEYITPLGIPKDKVVWIPNGVDLSLYPHIPSTTISHPERFTLMYFGAHGKANGLNNILQAMKHVLAHPNGQHIHLRMIGDGPLKQSLIAQASEMGLTNVSFEPSVPKNQVPTLAAQADAFIIAVLDLPNLYRYGISMNKLFDYLAAERPIIISSNAVNDPVSEAKAGLTVPAGKPELLANAILKISGMPLVERQRMGRAGREYVELNHSYQQLSARLANLLNEVCAENQQYK